MHSSAEEPRDAVVRTILQLERSCLDTDAALVERRWDGVAASLAHQEALTAQLGELFARAPETAPGADDRVGERLRGVLAYRDDQLRRLCAYRDDVGRQLQGIGKMRALARTVGKHDQAAVLYDTQQ